MKYKTTQLLFLFFALVASHALNAQDSSLAASTKDTITTDTINVIDKNGLKQGYWVKMHEGKKTYEGTFKDDIPVGKFIYYYENGVPWSISVFSNKGTVTHTQMYDGAGTLMGEGKYINQKKDSIWKYYNYEGTLTSIETYKAGVKNGISKVYYPSGALLEEKTWKNGKIEGSCKKYFENGQIRYDGTLVDGKVEGKLTFYYSNGKVHATGLYEDDLKSGTWNYYKKDGTLDHIEEYINGRLQGEDPNVVPWDDKRFIQQQKEEEQNQVKDPFGEQ